MEVSAVLRAVFRNKLLVSRRLLLEAHLPFYTFVAICIHHNTVTQQCSSSRCSNSRLIPHFLEIMSLLRALSCGGLVNTSGSSPILVTPPPYYFTRLLYLLVDLVVSRTSDEGVGRVFRRVSASTSLGCLATGFSNDTWVRYDRVPRNVMGTSRLSAYISGVTSPDCSQDEE